MYRVKVELTLETSPEQFLGTSVAYYPENSNAVDPQKPRVIPLDGRVERYFRSIGGRVEPVTRLEVARELSAESRVQLHESFRRREAPAEGWLPFIQDYVLKQMGPDYAQRPTGLIAVLDETNKHVPRPVIECRVGNGLVYDVLPRREGKHQFSPL